MARAFVKGNTGMHPILFQYWKWLKKREDETVMANDFIKVKCKCKNEQVIFKRASTLVKCLVCNEVLAHPTGGIAEVKAEIINSKVS